MEIHPGSIQGTLHPRFQKSGKTINFGISRSSRIGGAGGQAHTKSQRTSTHDAKIVMSLETKEDIQLNTETALSFQDDISHWQFKIGRLLKSKQDTLVSQFHYSSLKQEPAPQMHVNLPKINKIIRRGPTSMAHILGQL